MVDYPVELGGFNPLDRFIRWIGNIPGAVGTIGAIVVAITVGGIFITDTPVPIINPPGPDDCLVSNAADWGPTYEPGECAYGDTITRTNAGWTCNAPLSTFGTLPIRVVITSTTVWPGAQAVRLNPNCAGDSNEDTIDLIIEANGNGSTLGISGDVLQFGTLTSPGPTDIQLTINADCGDPGGHFDWFQNLAQARPGSYMAIVNGKSGTPDNPTCQAAGGMVFWSNDMDIDIIGGQYYGCNHGLNGNEARYGDGVNIRDVLFQVGRPGGCPGVVTTNSCIHTQGMVFSGTNVFRRWNGSAYVNDPCTA